MRQGVKMDQPTYCLTSFMVNQVAKIAESLGALGARAKTGSPKYPPQTPAEFPPRG